MDNLTHTLTAIAISQTGLNRKTRFATLAVILGANAPDIDIVSGYKNSITYLEYHRGILHSFIGITGLALIIWTLLLLFGRKARPKPGIPFNSRWLLLAAFLGTGSHLLLDFTNSYGVRPFLPFSGRWYAWDIMFIFDPLLWAIFIAGLGLPWLLRLVSEEVGARKPRVAPGAVFCLAGMVVLWGIRDFAHRRALSLLDSQTYSSEAPQRFSALPVATNPFSWIGIVETESAFHAVEVNVLDTDVQREEAGTFEKPQPSPALSAALDTHAGKVFRDFARYPWAQVEENQEGYLVSVQDLRFFHPSAPSRGFTLEVSLDKNYKPLAETFYFSAPGRP